MFSRLAPMALVLLLATSLAQAQGPDDGTSSTSDPDVNARVQSFARSKLGQKVGDGQCTSLVIGALETAGAKRFPPHGPDVDYVWGEYVERPGDVRPGDLLQFHEAVFRSKKRIRKGRVTVVRTETRLFPHHSAVVDDVQDNGRIIVILHQNAGPDSLSEEERQRSSARRSTWTTSRRVAGSRRITPWVFDGPSDRTRRAPRFGSSVPRHNSGG